MNDTPMTREDVKSAVREANAKGERPNLRYANLHGAHLSLADLSRADLHGAGLFGANLHGTILARAVLAHAGLRGADLTGADLRRADLTHTNLFGANLTGADLAGASLIGTRGVVGLGCTPSGNAYMVPLPNGTWRLSVGCWDGTHAELRTLIAGDDWPEAEGAEQDRRRPILAALADFAGTQAAYHDDWLQAVVKRWGDKEATR